MTLLCKNCKNVKTVPCRPGLGGAVVPRSCDHVPQVYTLMCLPIFVALDLYSLDTDVANWDLISREKSHALLILG